MVPQIKFLLKVFFIINFALIIVIAQENEINVLKYGAVGDGKTLNTNALQKAIDGAYENGGGKVVIPAGTFLTGSLDLRSNVELHISNGAVLLGSTDINDYNKRVPELESYNDIFLEHALIYAEKQKNIAVTGNGTINGQGDSEAFIAKTKKKPDRYKNRPFVIRFVQCENVKIKDVTMMNSAMWMQQYLACEDVLIDGIRVVNHANKNNDMIDIDGSRNVIMQNCIGDTDDDALTLKSTSEYPTENVTITNCILSSHVNAIKFGTESIGGFRNITISNIVIKPSRDRDPIYGFPDGLSGITLATVDGGDLEGILIDNIRIEGTQVPIYLRRGNRGRTVREEYKSKPPGNYEGVKISNVIATGVTSPVGCSITGIPGYPVKNITLSNISIEFAGGGTFDDAKKEIPELEDHYPESTKWGELPAYGFFVRHVEEISFDNIQLTFRDKDIRPAMIFDDVDGLDLSKLRAEADKNAESLLKFLNVKKASIFYSRSTNKTKLFLKIEGENSDQINLIGNDFSNVDQTVNYEFAPKINTSGNTGQNTKNRHD